MITKEILDVNSNSSVPKDRFVGRGSMQSNSYVNEDDTTWILTSAFIIFTMQSDIFSFIYILSPLEPKAHKLSW